MKWVFFLLSCCSLTLNAAGPGDIRTVYLMPMGHSLDQYLANQLTSQQVLQVVTDPKLADAVLTDRIGAGFEAQLSDLLPPPPPPPAPAKEAKDQKKDADKDKDSQSEATAVTSEQNQPAGFMSSYGGSGKGTVFLVNVKTRQVIWSTYRKPRDFSSRQLDRAAQHIVSLLKKDRAGK